MHPTEMLRLCFIQREQRRCKETLLSPQNHITLFYTALHRLLIIFEHKHLKSAIKPILICLLLGTYLYILIYIHKVQLITSECL